MRIYVLSIALALSACITPDNNFDLPEITPEKRGKTVSQPTSDKAANYTSNGPVPQTTNQKKASLKLLSTTDIIGQNKVKLLQILGRPNFQRRDPPAEIWRYHNETCLLDIYLYRPRTPGAGGAKLVTFIEARKPRGPRAEATHCLNIIHSSFTKSALG